MNKRQKLVQQQFLNDEKAVIKRLNQTYNQSLSDVNDKIKNLDFSIGKLQQEYDWLDDNDPEKAKVKSQIQSKIYQKNYQEQLRTQLDGILDQMKTKQFVTVSDYLDECYIDGFVGTIFDAHGQGCPIITPINQEAMVRAVQLESKISKGLYTRLGEDVDLLKKKIASEVSRGIATGMSFKDVAKQIENQSRIGYNKAVRIARTEGHRIQTTAAMDAMESAKDKGADVVKQWDATLDGNTRESHVAVDGQIREVDKPFSNGLMYPGDPAGGAGEVVNCRCALLQRARWALEDDDKSFTKFNNFTKQLETFDSPDDYKGFKKAFFSKENKQYMNCLKQMEEKHGTKKFANVLESMSDQEYGHYSGLLANNPIYNKNATGNSVPNPVLNQTTKITEKSHVSDYGVVNRDLVNSKEFHDKFEGITEHKDVNESLYQEAMKILEHRDGTPYEDMVVIDSRTGKVVDSVFECDEFGKLKITLEQYKKIHDHKGHVALLHNHPNSSRPSYLDIAKLKEANIDAVFSIGHDGSVYKVFDLDDKFDIDFFYNKVYNDLKKKSW